MEKQVQLPLSRLRPCPSIEWGRVQYRHDLEIFPYGRDQGAT